MIRYYPEVTQGSDEWFSLRCGLLTASEMRLIMTPTLKIADNEKTRAHVYEILAQRITNYVEPAYVSDDMLRGHSDELEARILYNANYGPVQDVGFVTNDEWGFTLGYSPDGLIGDDGLIEAKSRRQKYQMEAIIECASADEIPPEHVLQAQTGLLVTKRKWLDYITYSGGLPMATVRVLPSVRIQTAILEAAKAFEDKILEKMEKYQKILASSLRLLPTERRIEQEIII